MNRTTAKRLRKAIVQGSESLSDEIASTVPNLFPVWEPDTAYAIGDRRRYGETLYKCTIAHTSQADWTPDIAVSLWARTDDPGEEWPAWIQPTGASDAYNAGDKVSYRDKHWISNINANVWEPGIYGWDEAE